MSAAPDRARPSAERARLGGAGLAGGAIIAFMLLACLATMPYTLGREPLGDQQQGLAPRRFEAQRLDQARLPPIWAPHRPDELERLHVAKKELGSTPWHLLGTDRHGRDLLIRCLAGGGISLTIGITASLLAVLIGTLWGTIAGYAGGRFDSMMMRLVDIFYGLPYILLVVLLAVAVDGLIERTNTALAPGTKQIISIITLLIAIGSVSWLTMARVIRGQVLSLKAQPFIESARAIGVPASRLFLRHLLPNLTGPIVVYSTLTVPTAILSESFLSFLGIGVREPLPSWGNLAADGLSELNLVRVRWWLLLWPCLFIAATLLALNVLGEALRDALDPKRRQRAAEAPTPRRVS